MHQRETGSTVREFQELTRLICEGARARYAMRSMLEVERARNIERSPRAAEATVSHTRDTRQNASPRLTLRLLWRCSVNALRLGMQ